MILVRDVLQVKFGKMDEVLAGLKAATAEDNPMAAAVSRILTDRSGPYFTLIVETKAESMDAYWATMQAGFQSAAAGGQENPMNQFVRSGYREFFNIEYEAE